MLRHSTAQTSIPLSHVQRFLIVRKRQLCRGNDGQWSSFFLLVSFLSLFLSSFFFFFFFLLSSLLLFSLFLFSFVHSYSFLVFLLFFLLFLLCFFFFLFFSFPFRSSLSCCFLMDARCSPGATRTRLEIFSRVNVSRMMEKQIDASGRIDGRPRFLCAFYVPMNFSFSFSFFFFLTFARKVKL